MVLRVWIVAAAFTAAVAALPVTAACGHEKVLQQYQMEGASMEPALHDGDVLKVIDYGSGNPRRGDIVLYRFPPNPDREFVDRIVGLPGERVEVRDGQVLIND